ncbi:hypothetical protein DMB37_39245 [Nocardia sp. CS682]|nr:hypothetical protein DMB37_39245 [Nocardia sp. CS682]
MLMLTSAALLSALVAVAPAHANVRGEIIVKDQIKLVVSHTLGKPYRDFVVAGTFNCGQATFKDVVLYLKIEQGRESYIRDIRESCPASGKDAKWCWQDRAGNFSAGKAEVSVTLEREEGTGLYAFARDDVEVAEVGEESRPEGWCRYE